MQFQLIILGLVFIVLSQSTKGSTTDGTTDGTTNGTTISSSSPDDAADKDKKQRIRLLTAALRAINEKELQRLIRSQSESLGSTPPAALPQRINSKRLSLRTNSRLLQRRTEVGEMAK